MKKLRKIQTTSYCGSLKEGEPYWSLHGARDVQAGILSVLLWQSIICDQIDIHAGGEDLIFPHHENEIAQSECANDKTFANYWMHNGF